MTDLLDLLAAIATDPAPLGVEDRQRIRAAIRSDADAHGYIDPNRVRAALSNAFGLTVNPRALSATYSALRQGGDIRPLGFTVNSDRRGGNVGKPLRTYSWTSTDKDPR